MTSVLVIAALVILATALVCYVFISQHLAKKKKQQARVLKALKHRQQFLKMLVSELPAGYLPAELNSFVYRVLLNTCEQLAKLDPGGGYNQEFQQYSQQLQASGTATKVKLPPEKSAEASSLLKELGRYITAQSGAGAIPAATAKGLLLHIRRLLLSASVDSHLLQAKKARSENKLRLAIHYYNLARKLLLKENAQQGFQKQVDQLSEVITKLEQEYAAQQPQTKPSGEEPESDEAWNKLDDEDDWKKKQVYD